MPKKQVRGLLDYISLEEGEDWEFPPYSENYMPGIGTGASKEAIRWAFKGFWLELSENLTLCRKKVGRKKNSQFGGTDCKRAMFIWLYVNKIHSDSNLSLRNRHLIQQMQALGTKDHRIAKLFPKCNTRLESSVSSGKTKLQIDDYWNSEVCEKLFSN